MVVAKKRPLRRSNTTRGSKLPLRGKLGAMKKKLFIET
jgi:hypothetical protein